MKSEEKDKNKKSGGSQQGSEQKSPQATKPGKDHTSQGHSTDAEGSATSSKEPTLRSATTDSSRVPKNPHDDLPTGGNVR